MDLEIFVCPKSLWICNESHGHSTQGRFKCPRAKGQLMIQRMTDSLGPIHGLYLKSFLSQLSMNDYL